MRLSSLAIALGSFTMLTSVSTIVNAQSSNQLDGIVVTASQEEHTGVPGVTISREDLDRDAPSDIKAVFASETSVSIGGGTPVSQKLYVYGLEDSQLAVTIDGASVSNSTFHHAGTLLLDPEMLKTARIDPIVAGADAGPGALGGSVQFETVDAKDLLEPGKTVGGFVHSTFDTNGQTFTTAVSGYTMKNGFEALGYFKFSEGDDYKDGGGDVVTASGASLRSGLGKLAYESKSGDRFELSHEVVSDDAVRPYRANFDTVVRGSTIYPNQPYNLSRNTTVFTYTDEKPEGWWNPKIVLSYSTTKLDTFPDYESTADISTLSGKVENKFTVSTGTVTAGLDFFDKDSFGGNKLDGAGNVVNEFGTEKDRNVGIYAQARLSPTDRTRLSFGGRVDHQMFEGVDGTDLDNTGFSGNISGEYDINKYITLKAGYAHVFGRIPLAEALLNYNNYTYDGVEPFSSNNVTAGVSAKYKGFTFDSSYNIVKMDDAIAYYAARGSSSRNNTADIESNSFDIAFGYSWTDGFVKAKYANIEVTQDGEPIGTTAFYYGTNVGELISLQAAHKFAGTGLTIGGDINIALDLDQDDLIPSATADIPGYTVVNAYAQYQPASMPYLTLRAEVKNMFDEEYAARVTSGQEYDNITPLNEPGRSFYFSAKAKF
ncbi:MAG: TonB-dependent receptor domain-containing protein [Methyloligellaceae bacterium]